MSLNKSRSNIILIFDDVLNTYNSKIHGKKALSKYKRWFPVIASPQLAGLVADLIGDGNLQDAPKWRLDYCSKSEKELTRFENEIYNLFRVKGKIRKNTTSYYGSFNYGVNCKPLARLLKLVGVPTGAKVLRDFLIPNWIVNDKENFRRFIIRLFTCESSRFSGKYPWISIEMWKSTKNLENGLKFMNQIRHYLCLYFNVKTCGPFIYNSKCIRKDKIKTKPIKFTIMASSQLNFCREIKLEDKKKQDEFEKIIKRRLEILANRVR